ncbi:HNH endonuclease [Rhodococcus sp. EPR-157]|jgi:hypothetical protein|uniref:HNH endonuclease n=1 Tax=Rhodococcus sp. EPR-157 TaxID=1813677 RepID=UPI000AFBE378|nr:HNH endonuclease signature motif containing protein [Rhodococcus sp. EPR-157]
MLGKSVRLATPGQRKAVVIRDRCCVKCGRPAAWCQVHHVEYWQHGGATDLDNLALVCGECHRIIHTTEWELVIGDDGHPYLVPPPPKIRAASLSPATTVAENTPHRTLFADAVPVAAHHSCGRGVRIRKRGNRTSSAWS